MANELRKNSLGIVESLIMGIAGTAPAFSIEATAFTIIGIAEVFAPASILTSGLIMFGIAWAFIHLNKIKHNAGTSFAWVSDIFGHFAGFFTGWALLFLCCIFMVAATVPAANAIFLVVAPQRVNQVNDVTALAIGLLTIVSLVVVKGVKLTSYAQIILTIIEAVILALVIGLGYYHFGKDPVHAFSWNWLNPFAIPIETFVKGALVSVFFYYGWDVALNLAEETKDPASTPGRATFWTMIFLMAFFIIFVILILMGLSLQEIEHYNTNVIFAITEKVLGKELGYLAIVAVLLSTIGTIETQIIQFTRMVFAKSRLGALPSSLARLHDSWQTPYIAVGIIWFVGTIFILSSSYLPSINKILETSISAMSYQICFYLSLTGLACAWHFSDQIQSDPIGSLTKVWWPLASSLFLIFLLITSIATESLITNVIGIGGILTALIPWLWAQYSRS